MPQELLQRATEAVSGLRQALEADGYGLEVSLNDGRLQARIVATPDACADCLSPEPVMRSIIGAALRRSGLEGLETGLRIEYPEGSALAGADGAPVPGLERLSAPRHTIADERSGIEYCYEQGWTDGLPVVPPTPDLVARMLAAGGLAPDARLGEIPERRITIRAEQAAINAVMAGCLPEYFPVVLAAVRGILHPDFGLHGPSASTAGTAVLTIVSGPYARRIGMRSGENGFGPGCRANATIGRALRLLLLNAGAERFDRSTLGHPGKFTYCIAEQDDSGWEPLHVQRGLAPGASAVTVVAAEGPNQLSNHIAENGPDLLASFAGRMKAPGSTNSTSGGQQMALIICPEHRRTFQAEGWSKAEIQRRLWEQAQVSVADRKRTGLALGPVEPGDEERRTPVAPTPEDILIVAAGGEAGRFSAIIPGWGGKHQTQAVTIPIEEVWRCQWRFWTRAPLPRAAKPCTSTPAPPR